MKNRMFMIIIVAIAALACKSGQQKKKTNTIPLNTQQQNYTPPLDQQYNSLLPPTGSDSYSNSLNNNLLNNPLLQSLSGNPQLQASLDQLAQGQVSNMNNFQSIMNQYIQMMNDCNKINKNAVTSQLIGTLFGSQLSSLAPLFMGGSGMTYEQCKAMADTVLNTSLQFLTGQGYGTGTGLGTGLNTGAYMNAFSYSSGSCFINIPAGDRSTFCSQFYSTLQSNIACQSVSTVMSSYNTSCRS